MFFGDSWIREESPETSEQFHRKSIDLLQDYAMAHPTEDMTDQIIQGLVSYAFHRDTPQPLKKNALKRAEQISAETYTNTLKEKVIGILTDKGSDHAGSQKLEYARQQAIGHDQRRQGVRIA